MKSERILIVDDTPENIRLLGAMLKQEYTIAFAETGAGALETLNNQQIDLVLLDIMMPEMDGFEICRRIRATPKLKDLPVIFLSAKADRESVMKGLGLGGNDYIVKPFEQKEVLSRIRTQLDLRMKSKELKQFQGDESDPGKTSHRSWSELKQVLWDLHSLNLGYYLGESTSAMVKAAGSLEGENSVDAEEAGILAEYMSGAAKIIEIARELPELAGNLSILDTISEDNDVHALFKKNLRFLTELSKVGGGLNSFALEVSAIFPKIEHTFVDVNDFNYSVKQILNDFDVILPVGMNVTLETEELPGVQLNIDHLKLICGNLLVNSIEAMSEKLKKGGSPENQQISFRTFMENAKICLSVQDSGPGFPEGVLARGATAIGGGKSGPGLGLRVVEDIVVERYGGKILYGNNNLGGRVQLLLPGISG